MDTLRQSVRRWNSSRRTAFTLVELLVVITIIGILVSLITVAALGALRTARQGAIKLEINQIAGSFDKYKDSANSYPPNAVTDGNMEPVDENQVFQDLKRHLQQAFPKHREKDDLIRALAGLNPSDAARYPKMLDGGMTAAEAVVFWLGGFSSDQFYPISGEGGPAYPIPAFHNPGGGDDNHKKDPIESRSWKYEFEITRIGPRDDEGYFPGLDDGDDTLAAMATRFIEYSDPRDPTNVKKLRINFWHYTPGRSKRPVLYFDVSRHPAAVVSGMTVDGPFDPPAASDLNPFPLHVHALKMRAQSAAAGVPIQFANEGKFQVLHAGVDDEWGDEILDKTSAHGVSEQPPPANNPSDPANYLLFPNGPFTDAAADTIVSFVTQSRLEDAQQ
jgi:prepilin-type N-terminal cleavage/methylation domain-containing protein